MAHPPPPPAEPMKVPSPAPEAPKPSTSYDSAPPQALLDFMVQRWRPASGKAPRPLPHHAAFAARRRALSRLFPGETLVVPTGQEKVRSNDTVYRFRPGSDFYYLTGNVEPDCVLVMQPADGGGHRDVLFVEPNPGRSDSTFFTDRMKGELWVGPRLGVAQSLARYRVDECAAGRAQGLPFVSAWRGDAALARHPRHQPDGGRRPAGPGGARQGARHGARRDAPLQGRTGDPRALRGHRLHPPRLRGRHPVSARRAERARGGGRLQPARSRRGQRRRLRHHRRLRRPRLHPPLDAERRPAAEGRAPAVSTPASRATRSTPPTSPARCPSPGGFPASSARSTSSSTPPRRRPSPRCKPGQRLHGAQPRGHACPRPRPRGARHPRGAPTTRSPTSTSSTSATRSTT